jgi:hypothetical protein
MGERRTRRRCRAAQTRRRQGEPVVTQVQIQLETSEAARTAEASSQSGSFRMAASLMRAHRTAEGFMW